MCECYLAEKKEEISCRHCLTLSSPLVKWMKCYMLCINMLCSLFGRNWSASCDSCLQILFPLHPTYHFTPFSFILNPNKVHRLKTLAKKNHQHQRKTKCWYEKNQQKSHPPKRRGAPEIDIHWRFFSVFFLIKIHIHIYIHISRQLNSH